MRTTACLPDDASNRFPPPPRPQAGYAVIFLTRTGSIQPFTLDLPSPETIPLLQALIDWDAAALRTPAAAPTLQAGGARASHPGGQRAGM